MAGMPNQFPLPADMNSSFFNNNQNFSNSVLMGNNRNPNMNFAQNPAYPNQRNSFLMQQFPQNQFASPAYNMG